MDPFDLLTWCQAESDAMLRCLRRAVEIESPSSCRAGVNRLGRLFAREFEKSGARVRLLLHPTAGSALWAEFRKGKEPRPRRRKPILLLGHLDTVWDVGTLKQMPFRIRAGRAFGPGIFDMKAGIVCGLWAVRALRAVGLEPSCPVRFFLNSDEEVASVAFRRRLLAEARQARAVLVLEPAGPGGALKTARKGVGEFRLSVFGHSAHAGIDPQTGVNAIAELARQLLRIEKLAQPHRGITLNLGLIEGGTRTNVVPERASASIDVRVPRVRDAEAVQKKFHGLRPIHPEARLLIEGGINRPPMERRVAARLFHHARAVGRQLGMELEEVSAGGGSDGNFTAALGVPTLDGLGAVGDGAHARNEHIVIAELPRRTALIAGLLATL